MIFYFSLWIFFALKAIQETKKINIFSKKTQIFLFIFLTFIIGLRNEVGCDWVSYIKIFDLISSQFRFENFSLFYRIEPSFLALNILFSNFSWGYGLVNLVVGMIFSFCLIKFCNNLPRPWLGLTLALPYFIVVVAMGYTRQSVAIAISILSFLLLEKGKFYKSILIILLGTSFHRSALIFLFAPFINIGEGRRFKVFTRLLITLPFVYYLVDNFVIQNFYYFQTGYLENQEMSSSGSLVRIILCIVPSLIFLFNVNKFKLNSSLKRIIKGMSLLSILCIPPLIFGVSNTAVDRIALNFIPIQFIVGSYLPDTKIFNLSKFTIKIILIFTSFIVFFVWLNYATHAPCWVPYQNILFN